MDLKGVKITDGRKEDNAVVGTIVDHKVVNGKHWVTFGLSDGCPAGVKKTIELSMVKGLRLDVPPRKSAKKRHRYKPRHTNLSRRIRQVASFENVLEQEMETWEPVHKRGDNLFSAFVHSTVM